ncbi:diguanylate cyclase domain-containing protein [Streptomyces fradiae]|uniref:diguanylate cyclase domain-containing protein n=1 Tax=Streptomyces fradiae TaxID=1906 RepID=UPI0035BEA36C
MGEDVRLRAVVALAQGMAAAHTPRECWRAAALGASQALGGTFAALSVWERDLGRLRVLVNAGQRAPGEEEFPEAEAYPVHRFSEITEFLHERWAGGGEPDAWVETADGGPAWPAAEPGAWPGAVPGPEPGAVPGPEPVTGTEPVTGLVPGPEPGLVPGPGSGSGAGSASRSGAGPGPGPGPGSWWRVAALRRRGRGSCVIAPIVLHGRAWGELYVARPAGAPVFDRADADFATVLASVVAAGLAQTERLEEVRKLAFTDPLTGLANRRAVDARLDEAVERHLADGSVVSLLVCDLNGLKDVNDTHGHAVGDRLLERFGSVLSCAGARLPGALAARLGGDEFCLVAVGPEADEVVAVADELCVRAGELEFGQGVACGVASTGDPIGPVSSARRLFRLADAAQYRAKAARSPKPVVAGRDGAVVRLADAPPAASRDRRRFRDARPGG